MPNDNIMGIPTRACINGLTKEDTERLKNALIKKIEDNETTVNITEDGKVIVADNSGFYLSYDGNMIGIEQDISGDYIPKTVPYLPEDANENPLAPPNDTIMTSANIAVDPRIVHTFGNETINGIKTYVAKIKGICNFNTTNDSTTGTSGYFKTFIEINKSKLTATRNHWMFYIISRSRNTGFDLVNLYTSGQTVNGISLSLRSCVANYTYVLSEDDEKAYVSIICSNSANNDGIQAGILLTAVTFDYDAVITGSRITENVLGTEIGRLTP